MFISKIMCPRAFDHLFHCMNMPEHIPSLYLCYVHVSHKHATYRTLNPAYMELVKVIDHCKYDENVTCWCPLAKCTDQETFIAPSKNCHLRVPLIKSTSNSLNWDGCIIIQIHSLLNNLPT